MKYSIATLEKTDSVDELESLTRVCGPKLIHGEIPRNADLQDPSHICHFNSVDVAEQVRSLLVLKKIMHSCEDDSGSEELYNGLDSNVRLVPSALQTEGRIQNCEKTDDVTRLITNLLAHQLFEILLHRGNNLPHLLKKPKFPKSWTFKYKRQAKQLVGPKSITKHVQSSCDEEALRWSSIVSQYKVAGVVRGSGVGVVKVLTTFIEGHVKARISMNKKGWPCMVHDLQGAAYHLWHRWKRRFLDICKLEHLQEQCHVKEERQNMAECLPLSFIVVERPYEFSVIARKINLSWWKVDGVICLWKCKMFGEEEYIMGQLTEFTENKIQELCLWMCIVTTENSSPQELQDFFLGCLLLSFTSAVYSNHIIARGNRLMVWSLMSLRSRNGNFMLVLLLAIQDEAVYVWSFISWLLLAVVAYANRDFLVDLAFLLSLQYELWSGHHLAVRMCTKVQTVLHMLMKTTETDLCGDELAAASGDSSYQRIFCSLKKRNQQRWLRWWWGLILEQELRVMHKRICGVVKYSVKHKWKSKSL